MTFRVGSIALFALLLGACEPAGSDVGEMSVSCPAFSEGGAIPVRHTCAGDNVSLPLTFHDVPAEAKSLCLVLEDLDSPQGLTSRWVVWGIPATTVAVDADGMTRIRGAVVGKNDLDRNDYDGPCRPAESSGYEQRRYRITVRALDGLPTLSPSSGLAHLMRAVDGHVVAQGSLTGIYLW
ncbi:MAG: YbhB/YbcL family Raf kinase inhibitor-like protein [Myxococcota bacterium]|jgi:hypothetical protein|nr:YbhB/YbcL family Raf kinase inhibitor-like protein [Myxococcota bacterium]